MVSRKAPRGNTHEANLARSTAPTDRQPRTVGRYEQDLGYGRFCHGHGREFHPQAVALSPRTSEERASSFRLRVIAGELSTLAAAAASSGSARTELTDADGRIWAYEYEAAGRRCLDVPGVATFVCGPEPGVVALSPAEGAAQEAIDDVLFRGIVPILAHRSGLETLHASAVELEGEVVGFCGDPHSGKSTIAYALARRGYGQWSDDVLAIDADSRPARAVPLPFAPRLRDPSASFLPAAEGDLRVREQPLPVGTIFLLERSSGGEVRSERIMGADAFTTALGCSLFLEDVEGERRELTIRHFLALAAEVPLFLLGYPSDLRLLDRVLDAVEGVVAETVLS